jgi:hypothetical protein
VELTIVEITMTHVLRLSLRGNIVVTIIDAVPAGGGGPANS